LSSHQQSTPANKEWNDRQGHYIGSILFAKIGPTKKTARWYAVPTLWRSSLENRDTELELEALRGTHWVARLGLHNRFAELQWAATHLPGQYDHSSKEEIREAQRSLRRADAGWETSPQRGLQAARMIAEYALVIGMLYAFLAACAGQQGCL
jgi:hypothetical protein